MIMNQAEILSFIQEQFIPDRKKLIPLLQSFQWKNSVLEKICTNIQDQVKRPIQGFCDMYDDRKNKFAQNDYDLEDLGDISDFYIFLLNPEIQEVDDWSFEGYFQKNKEIHLCYLGINWFLPVYYLHTSYEKGVNYGIFYQSGPLKKLSEYEQHFIQQIDSILESFNYQKLESDFLKKRIPGALTDISEKDASVYDCLFSDIYLHQDEHIRTNLLRFNDPYQSQVTNSIKEYLNDDFELTRTERTLNYHNTGSIITIITYPNSKTSEVICKGYIDGIAGNEKRIKFGR